MEAVRDGIAEMIDEGMSLEEVMEADPASDVFPSSPFDAATGLPASQSNYREFQPRTRSIKQAQNLQPLLYITGGAGWPLAYGR